jgi:DNA mismatch repair protein MutL
MIRKLSPQLIREIAAGEVVNSPVDVLRELVENALDAGASRLTVILEAGGTTRIVVRDDGHGIPREELTLSAEAHSTSKLESLSSIRTLGFRGEGLYAICNSARLTLTSRPAGQLGGASLVAEGDERILSDGPAPLGTSAEVTRLFAALPARRAALETPAAEARKALALLGRYLLHHPGLQLRLVADGEERWVHGGGGALSVVKRLWGNVTANRLIPVQAEGPGLSMSGLISRPELTRPRRDRLFLAVNGRPVDWLDGLLGAVLAAYRELLPRGQYPVGVMNLALEPERVLVNTAPQKERVRLLEEDAIAAAVQGALEEALSAHPLARALPDFRPADGVSAAPRGAFPGLRFVGAFRALYLLAEAEGSLWLVDQHAAHERVIFEELQARYRAEPPLELARPELLPLSLEEEAQVAARADALAALGLALEPFGGRQWRVRRVPAFLIGHPDLVAEVVKSSLGGSDLAGAWRAVLGRLACLPAIKAGHRLSHADAQTLLDALCLCATPWVCPHGRPTALVLSELELVRRFGRRGPRAIKDEVTA